MTALTIPQNARPDSQQKPVSGAPVKSPGKVRWPRIHLIYFGLATMDVAAIAASLYVGFTMLTTFERGTDRNLAFDRQANSLLSFSSAITETQSVVVSGLMQRQVRVTSADVQVKSATFKREFEQFRKNLENAIPKASMTRIAPVLAKIESGFAGLETLAVKAMASIAAGDREQAWNEFTQMQSRYVTLQFLTRDINQKINLLRKSANEGDLAAVRAIQSYEYLITAALGLIICSIIAYGHFVGRLMRRKYEEVAEANEKLEVSNAEIRDNAARVQNINDEIAALNLQLRDSIVKLRDAQDELVRKGKMAQLGQLTATVAHELRNPLGAVRTSAFLLEKKVKGKDLGIEPQIERINNGVTRCDNIISQLLDFARSRAIQPEALEFDNWLAKLVEEEAGKLPNAVLIECHLSLGTQNVSFDPARMSRAVINLMTNASEALVGKGDDPARFAVRNPQITVTTQIAERGIEVVVSDNGPGIAPEHLEKILEPLFTTKSFGTGLGLPAVQKIAEQHGGGLEIASRPGQGARFTLWWPLRAPSTEAA